MSERIRLTIKEGTQVRTGKNEYCVKERVLLTENTVLYNCADKIGTPYILKYYNNRTCMRGSVREVYLNLSSQDGLLLPIDNGELDGIIFDILPWWAGRLSDSVVPSQNMIRSIIFDIMNGLKALHEHGIILRDLCSEHIIFDSLSRKASIAFFDNIAILQNGATGTTRKTFNRDIKCIPPEYEHEGDGYSGDYYALGRVLFEILYEKNEFTSEDLREIFKKLPLDKVGYLSDREKLEYLMLGLLLKNPAERWQAQEMICFFNGEMIPLVSKQGSRGIYDFNRGIEVAGKHIYSKAELVQAITTNFRGMDSRELARRLPCFLMGQLDNSEDFRKNFDVGNPLSDNGIIFRCVYYLSPTINNLLWGDYKFSSLMELANRAYHDGTIRNELEQMLIEGQISWWLMLGANTGLVSADELEQIRSWENWEREHHLKGVYRMMAQMAGRKNYRFNYNGNKFSSLTEVIFYIENDKRDMVDELMKLTNQPDFEAWCWINGKENALRYIKQNSNNRELFFSLMLRLGELLSNSNNCKHRLCDIYIRHTIADPIQWMQSHIGKYKSDEIDIQVVMSDWSRNPLGRCASIDEIELNLPREMDRYLSFVKKAKEGLIHVVSSEYNFTEMYKGLPVPKAYIRK